jgi:hypothetical protein
VEVVNKSDERVRRGVEPEENVSALSGLSRPLRLRWDWIGHPWLMPVASEPWSAKGLLGLLGSLDLHVWLMLVAHPGCKRRTLDRLPAERISGIAHESLSGPCRYAWRHQVPSSQGRSHRGIFGDAVEPSFWRSSGGAVRAEEHLGRWCGLRRGFRLECVFTPCDVSVLASCDPSCVDMGVVRA